MSARRPVHAVALAASLFVSGAVATGCSEEEAPAPSKSGSSGAADGGGTAAAAATANGAPSGGGLQSRNCASCHTPPGGPELSGATVKLPGYPDGVELWAPNLTPDPETGIGAWTDGQLALAIREGVDKEGMVLCPQMQHYRDMGDGEVAAIIKSLRALPPFKRAVKESVCPPLKR